MRADLLAALRDPDRGLSDRAALAGDAVNFKAVFPEDLRRDAGFRDQAHTGRDAQLFRADAAGKLHDLLYPRQLAVMIPFHHRRAHGDPVDLVFGIFRHHFIHGLLIQCRSQAEIRIGLITPPAVYDAAVDTAHRRFFAHRKNPPSVCSL